MKNFFLVLLFGILLSQSSIAKNNTAVDDVIRSSFSNVSTIEPKQIILTKEQFSQVQSKAKTAVRTKVYRYYDIKSAAKSLGYAVLITRKVRAKKATVLICI